MLQFSEGMKELGDLVSEPGIPRDIIDGTLRLVDKLDERFFIKVPLSPTTLTGKVDDSLKVTDRFVCYMTAFRARDWPQVRIIEHEADS